MSAPSARRGKTPQSKSWWSHRRNRTKVWWGLLIAGAALVAVFLWTNRGSDGSVPVGHNVEAVKLEDSRTGQMFDLGQYLGKKDIVLVGYMGDFCLGCRELIAELQRRAPDFTAAGAYLAVVGYETGQVGRDTAAKHGVTAYPLLQEGPPYTFLRSIGMWSDMMDMPFMGYVIIDKSGTIVAREQASLSEAQGAATANVNQLLAALASARARTGAAGASPGSSVPVVTP